MKIVVNKLKCSWFDTDTTGIYSTLEVWEKDKAIVHETIQAIVPKTDMYSHLNDNTKTKFYLFASPSLFTELVESLKEKGVTVLVEYLTEYIPVEYDEELDLNTEGDDIPCIEMLYGTYNITLDKVEELPVLASSSIHEIARTVNKYLIVDSFNVKIVRLEIAEKGEASDEEFIYVDLRIVGNKDKIVRHVSVNSLPYNSLKELSSTEYGISLDLADAKCLVRSLKTGSNTFRISLLSSYIPVQYSSAEGVFTDTLYSEKEQKALDMDNVKDEIRVKEVIDTLL